MDQAGLFLWSQLLDVVKNIPFTNTIDKPIWVLEPNGRYFVISFYNAINFGGVVSTVGDKF